MTKETTHNIARLIGVTVTWGAVAWAIYHDPSQTFVLFTGLFVTWLLF